MLGRRYTREQVQNAGQEISDTAQRLKVELKEMVAECDDAQWLRSPDHAADFHYLLKELAYTINQAAQHIDRFVAIIEYDDLIEENK
jgi:hypothetical protein